MKVACEKLSNTEPRNMAERTLKTLHKSAEGAESKMVIASKAFAFIKKTLDDKSSDREDSISTDNLTRATTDLVPLCKPVVKQSLGMWLEDMSELFNIRYMESKKDFAACQNAEVALRTQTAECSSAESTLAQQAQLCGGDFDRQHGVLLVFLGNLIWSSMHLVRELFCIRSCETLQRTP